jgi:hypothetical protein
MNIFRVHRKKIAMISIHYIHCIETTQKQIFLPNAGFKTLCYVRLMHWQKPNANSRYAARLMRICQVCPLPS